MIYRQAGASRALLARVEAGEELAWALNELFRWERLDAVLVRGAGLLEGATLVGPDGDAEPLDGPVALEALSGVARFEGGAVAAELRGVLVLPGPERRVVAGLLRSARARAVDLVLDVLEDGGLEWRVAPGDGGRRR